MSSPSRRYPHATGTGPGAVTADGCAVDLYALLPAGAAPVLIHEAIPAGASVLDLGAGTGRIAHPLTEWGHTVIAVDESPQMLAHIHGVETVCSAIEDLRLHRAFDVVLLASHLVNVPDDAIRSALLATCRHHVRPGGVVLLERFTRGWIEAAQTSVSDDGGVVSELRVVARPGPGLLTAVVEYRVGDRCWTQTFTTRGLDDDELDEQLARAGLRLDRRLTEDGKWVAAVPARER